MGWYSNRRSVAVYVLIKIVKMIVDGIDLVAYYKYKAVINNAQAVAYQDAVFATLKATEKETWMRLTRHVLSRLLCLTSCLVLLTSCYDT